MNAITKLIKNANPQELIEIYFMIEPKVLHFIDKEAEKEAFADLKNGRIHKASSAKEVMKKCLQK